LIVGSSSSCFGALMCWCVDIEFTPTPSPSLYTLPRISNDTPYPSYPRSKTSVIKNFIQHARLTNHTPFEIFRHDTNTPPNHMPVSLTNPLNLSAGGLAGRVTGAVHTHRTLSRPAENHKFALRCPASIGFPVGGYLFRPARPLDTHRFNARACARCCVSDQCPDRDFCRVLQRQSSNS
jgi:hypothetical protein